MVGRWDIRRLAPRRARLSLDGRPWRLDCRVADTRRARMIGLLVTRVAATTPALLLPGCRSVHGVGMRRALVCVFLDREGRVLRVARLRPWRVLYQPGAVAVLELNVAGPTPPAAGQSVGWSSE